MRQWQNRWDESEDGRWTHELNPSIQDWSNRDYGECSYHLTQLLTGHGSFAAYLNRIGRAVDRTCQHCGEHTDDARHTLFVCERWVIERRVMTTIIGATNDDPARVVAAMLEGKRCWDAVSAFATAVMRAKESTESGQR